jgi:hypothetical protein
MKMVQRTPVLGTPSPRAPVLFTADDYEHMHQLVFMPDYPGYRPNVVESPNGDGKQDVEKRYAHIAVKYLDQYRNGWNRSWLLDYLHRAHQRALVVATELGVPEAYLPSLEYGALRVLEYPPNTGSHLHTDFDLFTLNLYRDVFNPGLGVVPMAIHMGEIGELVGLGNAFPHKVMPVSEPQRSIVYFAIPDHDAVLPGGLTVGQWISERVARSRVVTP